jgi:hypothetical protein
LYRCSLGTVAFWVRRAGRRRLERVDWSDRPKGRAVPVNRTARARERQVVRLRAWLRDHDPLGYVGAAAIWQALQQRGGAGVPAVRTINRILRRQGVLPQRRPRQPPPPPGWYLPTVAQGEAELMQLDLVEGLHLRGLGAVEVLTGIGLWRKTALAAPALAAWRVETITPVLAAHWRQWGEPGFLQTDNDTRFAGSTRAVRRLGRFVRFCLAAGVVPVFAPPRETGFQAAIESFNGLWQQKVWQRFRHPHLAALCHRSTGFVTAHRARHARLSEAVPPAHRPAPADQIIFLRRTDGRGRVYLLGHSLRVAAHWPHRLVRCELTVSTQTLRCFALRRRQPTHQPLLTVQRFALR